MSHRDGAAEQKSLITPADIARRVAEQAFGRPLITNVLRGHVAEAIIASALEPDWRWCAEDYASWDFERADGLRLEVKQSAERQPWVQRPRTREVASFDIAERTGRYEADTWIAEPGRPAHLYVLAHHGVMDASADHRHPAQWVFYVVAAGTLPASRRIGIATLRQLVRPVSFPELAARVEAVAADIVAALQVAA